MNGRVLWMQALPWRKGSRPHWAVTCKPHVMTRLKRWFERADATQHGTVCLSDTPETARDLILMIERYSLQMDAEDRARLLAQAQVHKDRERMTQLILAGDYQPTGNASMALPAREYQQVAADLVCSNGSLLLADDLGLGKAQPLTAKVLTPSGWVEMGSLSVGSMVVDPDGGSAVVTGVFSQGEREVFRVTTTDGQCTECCDEHLWLVRTNNDKRRGTSRVLPLSEIRKRLQVHGWGQVYNQYFLPVAQPTAFAQQEPLPLDAYLLGLLIGDGSLKKGSVAIACADPEILEMLTESLPAGVAPRYAAQRDYRLSIGNIGGGEGSNPLLNATRMLGLAGKRAWEKRIPEVALRASVDERIALLQGLMDSDGTCDKKGSSNTFTTTSRGLADDVHELVGSLGGFASEWSRRTKYTYKGERKIGRQSWTLNIRVPFCPFRCTAKASRWRMPYLARAIKTVEPVGSKPVQCISVSSARSLYVTDGYIVTHNTVSAIAAIAKKGLFPALVVTLTHLPRQWQRELERFTPDLKTTVLEKATPYDLVRTKWRKRKPCPKNEAIGVMPDIIISNYQKLSGWAETFASLPIRSVVFDECHELRSGAGTAKYEAALHICRGAVMKLGLSGTPIYNYGGEIFNVLNVLAEDSLGTREEFTRDWCSHGYGDKPRLKDPKVFGIYARDEGLMLRRTRAEVGRELPALSSIPVEVEADVKLGDGLADLARIILAEAEAERGSKWRASGELDYQLRRETGMAKADFVAEFVKGLVGNGESVVLYGWHHDVYQVWRHALREFKPAFYTGKESANQKEAEINRFLSGETPVAILSLRAGAGLDGLQHVCRTVVVGELDWSPGVHEQAIGRVYRDGQQHPVCVYFPIADSGSDPIISDTLGVKRGQIAGLRDPDAPLVEAGVDPQHMRKLAESFLRQRGELPPEPAPEEAVVVKAEPAEVAAPCVEELVAPKLVLAATFAEPEQLGLFEMESVR